MAKFIDETGLPQLIKDIKAKVLTLTGDMSKLPAGSSDITSAIQSLNTDLAKKVDKVKWVNGGSMNNLKTSGFYHCTNVSYGPTTNWQYLIVIQGGNLSPNSAIQISFPDAGGAYMRLYNGTSWSAWKRLDSYDATTTNITSGYFSNIEIGKITRNGNVVVFDLHGTIKEGGLPMITTFANIPNGYKPPYQTRTTCYNSTDKSAILVDFMTNGNVRFLDYGKTLPQGTTLQIHGEWITNDSYPA